MNPRNFFAELQRRNVYKVAVAYAVVSWLLIQIATQVFPFFEIPNWVVRLVVLATVIGFPIALVIAWAFELTPEGLKRTEDADRTPSAHRPARSAWIFVVIIAGGISLGLFFLGRYTAGPSSSASPGDLPKKSIAVLPFVNMSGQAENNDFSDGITEEILNALAQISDLKVVARTSAFQFKGKNVDLRQVGETLGVAYVLEGSVQRAGDDVRVTAQLIDARNGYHRWSEKYDRKLTSIFAIEDEISKAIAGQMQVALGDAREQPLVKPATTDPQAHEFYLKGLARITARGPALREAVTFFKQAIAIDPKYAAAWAGLSQAYELWPWYKLGPWPTSLAQAEQAARRALSLDPELPEGHAALANVLRDRCDFAGATREYETALARNPGAAETLNQYAQMLLRMGQFEEAIKRERAAVTLDPLAPNPRYMLGMMLSDLHRYDEAIAEEETALSQNPGYTYAHFHLAYIYLYVANFAEAEKQARIAAAQVGEDPEIIAALVRAVAHGAERTNALKLISEGKAGRYSLDATTDAFWYVMLGENEKALEKLKQWAATAQTGELFANSQILLVPAFDPIRSDPRFQAIRAAALAPPTTSKTQSLRAPFTAARVIEEKLVQEQPDYAPAWSLLGLIDAALGRKEEAVREGQHACELLPITKDAWIGPSYVAQLAMIYAWVGENDLAIDKLREARQGDSVPSGVLKLDPRWDPLRGYPRFEKFVASLAPN
jgi:adenylate cyclase